MGTHATVAIENVDGTLTGIYVHYDGYMKSCGAILQSFTPCQVAQLIAAGNCSGVRPDLTEVRFYNEPANTYADRSHALECGEEFVYVYTPNGWLYSYNGSPWQALAA
jgi:hypothetical protein